jgi:predicted metalloprotease
MLESRIVRFVACGKGRSRRLFAEPYQAVVARRQP